MKRYLLFAGDTYYPAGGWRDFLGHFDTEEEALDHLKTQPHDWWEIVDAELVEVVNR